MVVLFFHTRMLNRTELTIETPLFEEVWRLYLRAFPKNERRAEEAHLHLMLSEKAFHSEVLLYNNRFVGLFFWWNFDKLQFVEHLAITPNSRNLGLGKSVLNTFIKERNSTVILEVEPPTDNIAERRISFYKRLGFRKNSLNYRQPPYRNGEGYTPLWLLSHPKPLESLLLKYFQEECMPIIYRANTLK